MSLHVPSQYVIASQGHLKLELTSRSPNDVQRGPLLALANDRSSNGVQRETLLALAKIILLVDICAVIHSKILCMKSARCKDGAQNLGTV